jgi:hypothetical protein
MIFEIIVEIVGINNERCPLFKSMCGCWVGCFEVGTYGMLLWVQDSSPAWPEPFKVGVQFH